MIDERKYAEVLDSGLLLDHYFLLCSIKNGQKLIDRKRVQGFVNLLTKKGYLEEDKLTEKGLDLVQNCGFAEIVEMTKEQKKEEVDFGMWIRDLYIECQDKLVKYTGQKQIRGKINKNDKKGYPFLPNETDLGKALYKVIKLYKIKDYEKIKKTILLYIDKCGNTGNWFPILQYYIIKQGNSQLVTDMSEENDVVEVTVSRQKFV